MKIKAVTFDLDDTLWPLREVIIHAHKESNNWIIDKFPNMSKVLFTEQEQKMWQKLIAKDSSLRHRLSELRMKVIETLLTENGVLVISGPKHPAERFVEGHIQSTIMPIFLQNLIFAGFDCKNAKILSMAGIENSFIIKKSKDFNLKERNKSNYKWTKKHQNRSFFKLIEKFPL